jgi:hypothetical protein
MLSMRIKTEFVINANEKLKLGSDTLELEDSIKIELMA